jgi:two-component system chemotaxis response regulator CheY
MLDTGDGAVMERADIKRLEVLIVGGKPHAVTILRTAFGIIGLNKVSAITGSERAIQHLRDNAVDAVFCDEAADTIGGVPFPLAARRAEGVLNPMLPIFLVCGSPVRRQIETARDDGITDVLVRPVSAATIIRKLRIAVLAPRPFILADGFFGPDRRGQGRAPFSGADRRKRKPKKLSVSAKETSAFLAAANPAGAEVELVE